jgi:predicted TIM-barrel fold metal-dependent hydrolase
MADYKMISTDSHVIEPRHMWEERIDKEFRDRAPKWVMNPEGREGEWLIVEGREPQRPVVTFSAGIPSEKLPEHQATASIDDCTPGGWDPAPRLKDMELDGVGADVIYTTQGLGLLSLTDGPYQRALFRGFNDWLADYCSYAPKQLLGSGMVSLLDVEEGISELRRCAKMGLRGAMVPCSPPDAGSYGEAQYDPFWAASVELNMPITLHLGTGHGPEKLYGQWVSLLCGHHDVQRTLTNMMFEGVFDRFPELKVVSSENDAGWVSHFLFRVDDWYQRMRYLRDNPLKLLPTEYFQRNVYVAFMDDPVGVATADRFFGADNFMWSSDYPHVLSTWPHSRDVVARNFEGCSPELQRKITRDNAVKLYGIDID